MKKNLAASYDILGISAASLCLVHCIIFPIITIIPLGITDNKWVDVFFACIGMFVVSKILMGTADLKVKYILTISILLIVTSVLIEIVLEIHTILIYIGGLGMIIGHFINYKSHTI